MTEVTGQSTASELERESAYLAMLYEHLETYRATQQHHLAEVRLAPRGGTPQARTERDALASQLERRLDALAIGDLPLCFGRLDLDDGSRLYVGRVGLAGDGDDPLLMDWRAPKAALFYSATSGSPQGVVRRRHYLTRGRELVGIDDEVFDLSSLEGEESLELHGDGALLAALSSERTGHMRDIVATIQGEQDAVIRSPLQGSLVVQGGPGTGKTAVALHRAAYLLYTHRNRLAGSGVLIVGPNPIFLRYIEQVLPSLGETGAMMGTPRSLYPGVRPAGTDPDATADAKGTAAMANVIAHAISDRQRPPRADVAIAFERNRVVLTRSAQRQARTRAQRSNRPHNSARAIVEASLLDGAMAKIAAERRARSLPEPSAEEQTETRRSIRRTPEFRTLMERMWPVLTPEQLLNDLFGTPALLRSALRDTPDIDPDVLWRERHPNAEGVPWATPDVALLDEAAQQLGSWTEQRERRRERRRWAAHRSDVEYARSVLSRMDLPMDIDAEHFANRFADQHGSTVIQQASNDRTWKFGHVIVDEAQELSPMAWRTIFRRIPDRSMTVVGDLAQCSALWAPSAWGEVFDTFAPGQWRLVELATNYRTPHEIMDVANAVLEVAAPGAVPTTSIRWADHPPVAERVAPGTLATAVAERAATLLAEMKERRLAVIAPPSRIADLSLALRDRLGEAFDSTDPLRARASLLAVGEAKGLEFDIVVIVEPIEIVNRHPRGQNDLYVALTRATQRLVVVHEGPLTSELAEHLVAD